MASSCSPGFWPSNLHTKPEFNVGGGSGDSNSGTSATAHVPYNLVH